MVVVFVPCCWRGVVGCCGVFVVCVVVDEVEGGVVVVMLDGGDGRELISGGDIRAYVI